jgi:hypothetical protein
LLTDEGKRRNAGAVQLLQLQQEACRQSNKDGNATEQDVDFQMRMNKDLMMSSLWKLNVVDIEMTLLHVCEMIRILRYLITNSMISTK